jgi:hypothetical protein
LKTVESWPLGTEDLKKIGLDAILDVAATLNFRDRNLKAKNILWVNSQRTASKNSLKFVR